MGERTRLHVGPGGGVVTITQDSGGDWSILFTPRVGVPIVLRDDGPLREADVEGGRARPGARKALLHSMPAR